MEYVTLGTHILVAMPLLFCWLWGLTHDPWGLAGMWGLHQVYW